jgi:putative FmdB family regulatory protein
MRATYSYRCDECGHITWKNHDRDERPKVPCEDCGSNRTHKVIIQVPNMKRVLTPVGQKNMAREE